MARLTATVVRTFPIPGDSDGAALKIQHLKAGEIQKVEAETSHWETRSINDKFESYIHSQPQILLRKLRTAALVGWKGFFDADGNELLSDSRNIGRNRERLLDDDPVLGEGDDAKPLTEWIDDFRKELADELKEGQADPN